MRIGVLGGTFDPVHHGHLILAETAAEQENLDRVLLVPARIPPHKRGEDAAPAASAEHRAAMCELACELSPVLVTDRLELERDGPSWTVDTVDALRARHGDDTEILWIVGADTLPDVPGWHRADELAERVVFLAAPRPGSDSAADDAPADATAGLRVRTLDAPRVEISSTDLRRRIREGRSLRWRTPAAVADYIARHGLYGGEGDA